MALNIDQQPPDYSPAYNELVYVVYSDKTNQTNFKFVCDVLFETDISYHARVKLNTRPNTDRCVFDAHRIVEDYLNYDLPDPSAVGFSLCSNSYVRLLVKFYEEYGSTPAIDPFSLQTSNTITVFNGIFDFEEFHDYDPADWHLVTSGIRNCLTNAPLSQSIMLDQSAFIYFLQGSGPLVDRARITTYNSSGTPTVYEIANAYNGSPHYCVRFSCGPADLLSIGSGTFITGAGQASPPIDFTGISYYTIQFRNGSTAMSQTYTFKLAENCRYDVYRLHFLNKRGGFDAFNFGLVSRHHIDLNRKQYKQNVGSLSVNVWSYNKSDRGDTVYDTSVKDKLKLTSDWITWEESIWLEELITSPQVFLEKNGELIPYIINTNNYEIRSKKVDKLFNLEIEVQPAYNRYRQRG